MRTWQVQTSTQPGNYNMRAAVRHARKQSVVLTRATQLARWLAAPATIRAFQLLKVQARRCPATACPRAQRRWAKAGAPATTL